MVTPKRITTRLLFWAPGKVALRWIVMILFFIPVQTFFLEGIKIRGVKPDMGFLLAYIMGLTGGPIKGLLAGLLFGGLQDLFTLGRWGPYSLINGGMGVGIGLLERFFLYVSLKTHVFIILLASLIHDLIGEISARGFIAGLEAISGTMIGQAFYNSAMAVGIFLLFWSHPLEENLDMTRKEDHALFSD